MSVESPENLKQFVVPWKGGVVLACKRCQKKLRKDEGQGSLGKLKKWFKKRGKTNEAGAALRVIDIPCQDICPKKAVVVLSPSQVASQPSTFSIVSNEQQLDLFYQAIRKQVIRNSASTGMEAE